MNIHVMNPVEELFDQRLNILEKNQLNLYDQFMMAALQGFIAADYPFQISRDLNVHDKKEVFDMIAGFCVMAADSMMKAREVTK